MWSNLSAAAKAPSPIIWVFPEQVSYFHLVKRHQRWFCKNIWYGDSYVMFWDNLAESLDFKDQSISIKACCSTNKNNKKINLCKLQHQQAPVQEPVQKEGIKDDDNVDDNNDVYDDYNFDGNAEGFTMFKAPEPRSPSIPLSSGATYPVMLSMVMMLLMVMTVWITMRTRLSNLRVDWLLAKSLLCRTEPCWHRSVTWRKIRIRRGGIPVARRTWYSSHLSLIA